MAKDSASKPTVASRVRDLFLRVFPVIAGMIVLALAAMGYQMWRENYQRNTRAAAYNSIIERDWGSRERLRKTLERMEDLREQARAWTAEQLKSFRQNDVRINGYDYDRLWDTWKRYEIRTFEPEVHALAGSRWNETEILELLTFYVREMKARWEIMRENKLRVTESKE